MVSRFLIHLKLGPQVYAHPEHADALEALYAKMTELAQTEPGVIHYCLARRTDDPMAFHFFERYESKAAFEEHVSREETQKILGSGWVRDTVARFERPIKPPACL